jgi:HEAT repeat protein
LDLDVDTCPRCGARVKDLDMRTYTEKLIAALQHPEAETVARVAAILAKTAPDAAVLPLTAALRRYWHEPYLAAAMVDALAGLDSADAHAQVTDALGHESLIVRAAAAKALQVPRSQTRTPAR